jgi:hypothetical protein
VTDDLLPAALTGLPAPWNLTSAAARRAALSAGSADAPAVLDRVLGELPALLAAEPDDDDVPAELGYYFDFTATRLAEAIPVLDSVSEVALTELLHEWTGEAPDPAGAAALGRRWLALEGRQLAAEAVSATPPAEAGELAAVLGRHLGRLDSGTATYLLALLAPVREDSLLSLLESVAADDGLDAEVRGQARRMLVAAEES